jgi:hypothetical protein
MSVVSSQWSVVLLAPGYRLKLNRANNGRRATDDGQLTNA